MLGLKVKLAYLIMDYYGTHFLKGVLIGAVIILLTGCGTLPAVVGTSATTYESYKT